LPWPGSNAAKAAIDVGPCVGGQTILQRRLIRREQDLTVT
jgi:hypothetical protein